MAFSTQFPVRITLSLDSYDMLLAALKGNEEGFGRAKFSVRAKVVLAFVEPEYNKRSEYNNRRERRQSRNTVI